MTKTILCGALFTPTRWDGQASLQIDDGRVVHIEALASAGAAGPDVIDARDAIVIPGLVDLQVNGALGWSFQVDHAAHYNEILAYHLAAGTTSLLPTLITAPEQVLTASLSSLARQAAAVGGEAQAGQARTPGIHLEGPFLNPEKSGAHDPSALRAPDLDLARRLVTASAGCLKIVTLAPELPGAPALIGYLAGLGITVSAGHTAATYDDMQRAITAGLRMVTHAGNASDWPHRALGEMGFLSSQPGLVGTLMADDRLMGGVILDGFHFHPALLAPLLKIKGPDHLLLVSDASSVAGCPPGDYDSGGLLVTIHPQGFATSGRGGGWLAGSTITLLDAVRRSVSLAGLPLQTAVHMATLGPARAIGAAAHSGHLTPGAHADLLILNQNLSLRQVLLAGEVVRTYP